FASLPGRLRLSKPTTSVDGDWRKSPSAIRRPTKPLQPVISTRIRGKLEETATSLQKQRCAKPIFWLPCPVCPSRLTGQGTATNLPSRFWNTREIAYVGKESFHPHLALR